MQLFKKWGKAASDEERTAIWREMLQIHAENVFSIGIVNAAPQPVVVSNRVRNVPEEGLWAWDPGAQLGVYRLDEFFFVDGGEQGAKGDS